MGEAFRSFKKMLYAKYITKEKTSVFEGAYEKLRQQWPEFVAFKASERAKEMLEKIRQMLRRRHITIFGGQTATRVQCLSGKLWRMN
jgi:16S rRNA C1402 (ribose-2'-O) methylase RsmI